MSESAAVAIVGGGVIGASIAYHLAVRGVRDIVILDRSATAGAGSTGKATGGFRAQFATPINVRLSLLARKNLLRFEEDTGVDPGFSQVGYLWLASNESQMQALRTAQRMQNAEGLHEATELALADVQSVNSAISMDGIVGAAFCPTDGYIRPLEILRGYLQAAERLGVTVRWGTTCNSMQVDGNGRVTGVITDAGRIDVDTVVNAAGPWAARIAAMAGVSLLVSPLKRQVAITEPCPAIPSTMPMTIFIDTGFHIRARDGRAMVCWPDPVPPGEPADLRADLHADPEWIDAVTAMAHARVPALRGCPVDRTLCYAGLYEVSPDEHAIVGLSPNCENMYFANGSSGHGVMHSPALGAIVADMIIGREPGIDVSILRPSRFDEGNAIASVELI